jgi:hypothetical protein
MKKVLTFALIVGASISLNAQNNQAVVGQASGAQLSPQGGTTTDVPSRVLLNYTDVTVFGDVLVVNRKGDHVQAGELKIMDLSGKLIFSSKMDATETFNVQVSNFAAGVHLVVVESTDNTYVEKVFLK